jgi:hypothetical protein
MKYIEALIFGFFTVFLTLNANAMAGNQKDVSLLASKFFSYMNQNNYIEAAKLFHYPPNYTTQDLEKDIKGVSGLLEALKESFGQISRVGVSKTGEKILSLQVGGGDIPYWKQHPQYLTLIFSSYFSKYGDGYITFTICNISKKFEIREVKYGLAATRANSAQLLQEAIKHIQIMDE